jgi:hypothetical protein
VGDFDTVVSNSAEEKDGLPSPMEQLGIEHCLGVHDKERLTSMASCSCQLHKCGGLPCQHMLHLLFSKKNKATYRPPLSWFHPFWLLNTESQFVDNEQPPTPASLSCMMDNLDLSSLSSRRTLLMASTNALVNEAILSRPATLQMYTELKKLKE